MEGVENIFYAFGNFLGTPRNEVLTYIKHCFSLSSWQGLSKQLFNLKFDLQQPRYSGYDIDNKLASSDNEFVSAVCWKKSINQPSNTIIAGNSRGIIKILELV